MSRFIVLATSSCGLTIAILGALYLFVIRPRLIRELCLRVGYAAASTHVDLALSHAGVSAYSDKPGDSPLIWGVMKDAYKKRDYEFRLCMRAYGWPDAQLYEPFTAPPE